MKLQISHILNLLILLALVSCKTRNIFDEKKPIENKIDFQYQGDYQYKIRKNDKITLSVWGHDDLSVGSTYGIYNSNEVYGKWLLVDANGNIEIPRIGTTNVMGKTLPELKEEIKIKLSKWIVNPIIDVKVLNKEITILGEVRNPAVIQVDKDQNTLIELVSKAGGFEFYANLRSIKILRQEGENVKITNIDLTQPNDYTYRNTQLYPGDYVIVPSKKNKEFDKRVANIIPLATTVTAVAILMSAF